MTAYGCANAGKAAASARFPRIVEFLSIITCLAISTVTSGGCSSRPGRIAYSKKMGESQTDAGRKARHESTLRSSRKARATETSKPRCRRARLFLEAAYWPLVNRFGKKYYVLDSWLTSLIYNYPTQMWKRVKYRRLKMRTVGPSIKFNSVGVALPDNQKARLTGRWKSNHRYVSESFRITVGKAKTILRMKIFTAGPPFTNESGSELNHSPATGYYLTPTGPPSHPMPDLLRALRYSDTTPLDLYPLIGEQSVKPMRWQLRRLRHVYHRVETKYYSMESARDCLFNGHLFAMAGALRVLGRERGLVSLYLPDGPFIGELIFRFPAGYSHGEEITEEEAIFRGVRVIPSAGGGGDHRSPAK